MCDRKPSFLTLGLPLVSVSYLKFGLGLLFSLVALGGHFVTFIVVIKLTERLRGEPLLPRKST